MVSRLFRVSSVPLRVVNGQPGLDLQTCRELVQYAKHFDEIIYACPQLPESISAKSQTSDSWQAVSDLPPAARIKLVALPWAYRLQDFIRTYRETRQLLVQYIEQCAYLWFVPTAVIGDWSGIACLEALRLRRSYAVSQDRVEYEVVRKLLSSYPIKQRVKETIMFPLTKHYVRFLVHRSEVGLFHGQDCYGEFSPICRNGFCVYDVHSNKQDQIDEDSVQRKLAEIESGAPLKIAYAGRAAEMKGGIDWVQTIARLYHAGVSVQATWFGDGPLLSQMQQLADALGVRKQIHFVGFVNDLKQILEALRQQHIFMFCHKTPESPRCLVEALVSGCPLVGYDSGYARGLVATDGGGVFVPVDEVDALAQKIIQLADDRFKLSALIRAAAKSGRQFDEETVLSYRLNLLKTYLGSQPTKSYAPLEPDFSRS